MSETRVGIYLVGKDLKHPKNKTGPWARWNVIRPGVQKQGRTGVSVEIKRPLALVLNEDDPPATFEAFMTSVRPNGSPPPIDKATHQLWRNKIKPVKGGGEIYIYLSRRNNKWCLKQSAKRVSKKRDRKCKKKGRL